MISVGRAGCIRSNIMQAHTGTLLECVRSLGSCAPTIVATARPFRGALYGVHAEHKAPRYERTVLLVRIQPPYVCGFTLLSRRSRARVLPTYGRERTNVHVYVCVCTTYPTCIEIAGALNPGSGHEIVIPERLTLLPHLAGPRGRA